MDEPAASDQGAADIADWNRNAASYAAAVGGADDRIYGQMRDVLWETLGDLRGLSVLDLGCGHGWFSGQLHAAGAQVWGIDGSDALLALARERYPDIAFSPYNLAAGLPPSDRRFDRIVALMVLMDLPDLDPIVAAVRSALAPDGRFIFTLTHPCFFNMRVRRDEQTGRLYRMVTGYLRPAVWRIETFGGHNHYHRSVTDYVEYLRRHDLAVTRLYEPPHQPGPTITDPQDRDFHTDVPVFLMIEAMPVGRAPAARPNYRSLP